MEKVRTIRLYGLLGKRFGRVHRCAVNSTREAMRALCAMLPGFESEMMGSAERGVRYACFIGTRNIAEENLGDPPGDAAIRIAPVLQGAKRMGLFQTIAGIAMVAAGAFFQQPWLMQMGGAMALGGAVQMLAPTATGLGAQERPDNGASYNMNGAVNLQAQGNPEPVAYGLTWAGSVTVSAGIYAEDQQ